MRQPSSIKLNSPLFSFTFRFGVAFTYYGISLNVTGFGLNPYLTQLVFACIEIPGKLIVYFSLNALGRRPCQVATTVLTGVCIFINLFVPSGKSSILLPKCITQLLYMAGVLKKEVHKSNNDFYTDLWIIRTVVAVSGKGLSEAAFTIMFLYTAEFFPTVVR